MSADLFAEFGPGATSQRQANSHQQATQSPSKSLVPDFEEFGDIVPPPAPSSAHTWQWDSPQTVQTSQLPGHVAFEVPKQGDVLFDAAFENASADEDWGDFESADATHSQGFSHGGPPPQEHSSKLLNATIFSDQRSTLSSGQIDLLDSLSLEDTSPSTHGQSASRPVKQRTATQVQKRTPPSTKPNPAAQKEPEEPFEDWGDFIDGPALDLHPKSPRPSRSGLHSSKAPPQNTNTATKTAADASRAIGITSPVSPDQVRPTNIPPPSVLLELFLQLFEQLRTEAMQAKKSTQQGDALETAASSIYCALKAAARVVAGRTLRWKRDAILSQSMRIGPARSGKPGGMKLNTVNKNEDIKERQEAVDVITLWRDRAALFNSVIQASGRRAVPVIPDNIRVVTATASQGALKASHACALCGLKRDERLPKVDENVEDSFGEWWTDHWGHTECRDFWGKNHHLLGHR